MKEYEIYIGPEIDRLKTCPFCGNEVEVYYAELCKGSNSSGKLPEGSELVDTEERSSYNYRTGNKFKYTRYHWVRKGFKIHCKTKDCILRNIPKGFMNIEDLVDAWNNRRGI